MPRRLKGRYVLEAFEHHSVGSECVLLETALLHLCRKRKRNQEKECDQAIEKNKERERERES